jgi:DNA-binding transcriptional regulator YhcF (GntR family)
MPPKRARRPRHKLESILAEIRSWIISGKIPPAGQLPTRETLIEKFDVSSVTIQRALDQLVADGFVYARPRHGTFVSDHPPHLFHYGLVFSSKHASSSQELPSKFWVTLANLALTLNRSGGRRISLYFEVDDTMESRDGQRLRDDVAAGRLAGLILTIPRDVRNFVTKAAIPAVSFNRPQDWAPLAIPTLSCIDLSLEGFIQAGIDRLVSQGAKRLAVFFNSAHEVNYIQFVLDLAAKAGLQTHRHWVQGADPINARWVRNVAPLLFSGPAAQRPDSVLITDDHLCEPLCEGMADAGITPGKDVKVISNANFPAIPKAPAAVQMLGFQLPQTLEECLDVIDRKRRNEKVPNVIIKWPTFAEKA